MDVRFEMPNWRAIEGGRWLRTLALSITDILKLEQVRVKEICPFVAVTCLEVKQERAFGLRLRGRSLRWCKKLHAGVPGNNSLRLRTEFRPRHRV